MPTFRKGDKVVFKGRFLRYDDAKRVLWLQNCVQTRWDMEPGRNGPRTERAPGAPFSLPADRASAVLATEHADIRVTAAIAQVAAHADHQRVGIDQFALGPLHFPAIVPGGGVQLGG